MSFTVLDLYSGIGGFALATEWAGGKTTAFCEISSYQQSVLRARFPEVQVYDDVTKLCRRIYDCDPVDDGSETVWCPRCEAEFGECACIGTDQYLDTHGRPDVITAGVPCQPASLVGKRRGTSDARWLWPDTLRIVGELEPKYVICENPRALLSLEGGSAFRGILAGFAALGYDVQWYDVPAAALGAGHRRERLWLVASHADCPRLEGYAGHGETVGEEETHRYPAACNIRQREISSPLWYHQSCILPVVDGLSARLVKDQLTAVGNSLVPQVAYVWLSAIARQFSPP